MRHWRWYSKLLFAILVAAFAYWVWPTPWVTYSQSTEIRRVHRVTGQTQVLMRWAWWNRAALEGIVRDARALGRTDTEIQAFLVREGFDAWWASQVVTAE